ncbi:MAG: type II toxin-antitoxin system HicA family toxin [Betaproteobacteria bacterium]|nr:type II toxin-antitoxin system HicA family toxin [Betaproteobacteria bacterium]
MPKRWSTNEIERILLKNGFRLVGQKGSHRKYMMNGRVVIVPAGRKEVRQGTFASILRQSGLDISDFLF